MHGWELFHQNNGDVMLRIYGLIIILGLLAGVGYGAYYYYNDTQQRLATLRDNNAKLEVANKQNQETIKMMKENYEKQTKLNNELSAKLKDAEVYGNELRKKLSKIDLPAASLNRPEETEKRINDASQKVLDILESITARKSK